MKRRANQITGASGAAFDLDVTIRERDAYKAALVAAVGKERADALYTQALRRDPLFLEMFADYDQRGDRGKAG